ncbi:MAG: hypothetical protein RR051_00515 [Clostridiales bacterium]
MKRWRRGIVGNTKGMTMVELMVSFAVLLVVIGLTGGMMISSFNNCAHSARSSQAQQLAENAYNFMANRLTYAVNVDLSGAALPSALYIADGRLFYQQDGGTPMDVFGADNYTYLAMNFSAAAENNLLHLVVTVKDEDGVTLYEKDSSFALINIARAADSYLSGEATVADAPRISFTQIESGE